MAPGLAQAGGSASLRELRIVTGQDAPSVRQIVQALKARYPNLVMDAEAGSPDARRNPALCLSLGTTALRSALELTPKVPVLAGLISSVAYRQVLGLDAASPRERGPVSAVFTDASPQDQMQLIAAIFERQVVVGVPLSEACAHMERPLRLAAAPLGIELLFARLDPSADLARTLNRLAGAQVLLALPDTSIYTPDSLRLVLESTYRRGIPVIGFSPATVAAGTLATCYAALDDVLADLGNTIDGQLNPGAAWPEARFPRYWRVAVNGNVARSLGIAISDKVLGMGHPADDRSPR